MRTHLEFRSTAFPPYEGEEEQINPGRYGRRLAEFLQSQLAEQGFDTEEPYSEDWGWAVPIANQTFALWIGCGNYEEYPDGFLCFIEPSKPVIRRWLFRKIDTTATVERVAAALEKALTAKDDVRDLKWWSEEGAGGLALRPT
jgi:hypothetical protein